MVLLKNLVFAGPINNLGYGVFFVNLAENLIELCNKENIDIGIISNSKTIKVSDALERKLIDSRIFNFKCPTIFLYHLHGLHNMCGGYRVGFPIFELDEFSATEINSIKNTDELWVCSNWAKNIIKSKSPNKIVRVIPGGVDRTIFNEIDEFKNYKENNGITICSVGKLEKRKGHFNLIEALHMVDSDEAIRLIAKWNNPFIPDFNNHLVEKLRIHGYEYLCPVNGTYPDLSVLRFQSTRKANLLVDVILNDNVDSTIVRNIYMSSNFAVFPYFAEGWNLPLLEAMSCGIPCLATNYSAPTEYLNKTNHIPLTNLNKEIAFDGIFFGGNGGSWMSVDVNHIAEQVTYCINNLSNLKSVSEEGVKTAKEFSWKKSAEIMLEIIKNESPFKEAIQS